MPKLWKFLRMRPSNFPTISISQFARSVIFQVLVLLTKMLELNRLNDVRHCIKSESDTSIGVTIRTLTGYQNQKVYNSVSSFN